MIEKLKKNTTQAGRRLAGIDRRVLAGAGVIGALAIGGTAIAATDERDGDGRGTEMREELAKDLAAQLDGVTPQEASDALQNVFEEHMEERRTAMAEGIANQLDGVDAGEVADALEAAEQKLRDSAESGERPDPGAFAETLADELGLDTGEVEDALQAAREQAMEDRGFEGGPGLPPGGPGGPGFGPGPGGPGFGPGGPGFGPPPPGSGSGQGDGQGSGSGSSDKDN